ncbi:DUF3667 domain-containing protein [Rubricoccus marinus]|uniref:DUF3667 domain-containing protein n=1 Tax=Rubricoccus marinus TaxID=716817 RepID=A0A259TVM7_9BACT|nr:DUF3667 domain-containing protein [Rubricoccus marinus]OZC01822.1 hypothetical protein BSZ36_01750 [Rubricoccus marinus]
MTEPILTASPAPCVSCGAVRSGPYCSACGQKERAHRLTLGSVAREALQHLTSLDRGFGRTVVDLVRRPAEVATDYWRGRTVPYAGPGRFFLVAVTLVQVAVFALGLAPEFIGSLADGFNSGRTTGAEIVDHATLVDRLQRFWVVGLAGLVPVMTLWSRTVFRRARRTLAEHAVAHLYFLGVFVLGLGLVMVLGNTAYQFAPATVGYAIETLLLTSAAALYVWSLGRAFGQTWWAGLAGGTTVLVLGLLTYIAGVSLLIVALQRL